MEAIEALKGLLAIIDSSFGVYGAPDNIVPWEKFPEVEEARRIAYPIEIVDKYPFEDFWSDYDKKVGDKTKLQKKWAKLSNRDKEKIREYIPNYKAAQPDKKYRKNPETFLNNKSWNDELIYAEKDKRYDAVNFARSIANGIARANRERAVNI